MASADDQTTPQPGTIVTAARIEIAETVTIRQPAAPRVPPQDQQQTASDEERNEARLRALTITEEEPRRQEAQRQVQPQQGQGPIIQGPIIRGPQPPLDIERQPLPRHPLVAPLVTWVQPLQPRAPRAPDYWSTARGYDTLRRALWAILRHRAREEQRHLPKSVPVWVTLDTVEAQLTFDTHGPPTRERTLHVIDTAASNDVPGFLHYWDNEAHWVAANPAVP